MLLQVHVLVGVGLVLQRDDICSESERLEPRSGSVRPVKTPFKGTLLLDIGLIGFEIQGTGGSWTTTLRNKLFVSLKVV